MALFIGNISFHCSTVYLFLSNIVSISMSDLGPAVDKTLRSDDSGETMGICTLA